MSWKKIFKIKSQINLRKESRKGSVGEEQGACNRHVMNSQLGRENKVKRKVQISYIFSTLHTMTRYVKIHIKNYVNVGLIFKISIHAYLNY